MRNHSMNHLQTLLLFFMFILWAIFPADGQQPNLQPTIQSVPTLQQTQPLQQPALHVLHGDVEGTLTGLIEASKNSDGASTGNSALQLYFMIGRTVQHQAKTGATGRFRVSGISPGAYSLVICGTGGFTAHGVYVAESPAASANRLQPGFVSPKAPGFQAVLNNNLPREVAAEILRSYDPKFSDDPTFSDVTASFKRTDKNPPTEARQVRLNRGQLRGRLGNMFGAAQDFRGIMVSIVQDGRRVAEAKVDDRGLFAIPNLQPGAYEFVAVGRQGFAAVRFNVIDEAGPMTQISFQQNSSPIVSSLDVCLTCRNAGVATPASRSVPEKPMHSVLQSRITAPGNRIDYRGYVDAHLANLAPGKSSVSLANFEPTGFVLNLFAASTVRWEPSHGATRNLVANHADAPPPW